MSQRGRIENIHVASAAGEPMRAVDRVTAVAGRGLDGDRYAAGTGHWSPIHRSGDALTLIEAEELDRVAFACSVKLWPGVTRRNLTTRGIRLDELIGRAFFVGDVECLGMRRCEPCSYLDGLLDHELLPALVHRGGIRAEVVTGGTIEVGDVIRGRTD